MINGNTKMTHRGFSSDKNPQDDFCTNKNTFSIKELITLLIQKLRVEWESKSTASTAFTKPNDKLQLWMEILIATKG